MNVGDPFGELNAAALDADQDQVVGSVEQLDDLIGHASQGAGHGPGVEDGRGFGGHKRAQYVAPVAGAAVGAPSLTRAQQGPRLTCA